MCIDGGLSEWLTQLRLERYDASARAWCKNSGVKTADGIASRAAEIAAAREKDEDQRARIKTVFTQAAQGDVHVCTLVPPVKLKGRVHGKLCGE